MSKKDKGRLPPFVPLLKDTMATPAWRATSHGARSLYVALKMHYSSNFKNNGRIYLSTRDAARELGSNRDAIQRWFRELQHYGFIVMTSQGCLGVEGRGKAPHWRLTELGYMTAPPTREFERWSGIVFRDAKKLPGPKCGARMGAKSGPVLAANAGPLGVQAGPESGAIFALSGGRESEAITSLTTGEAGAGSASKGMAVDAQVLGSDLKAAA
jgi:hypothetical protein